ncbi:NPCBM/NEW2 domain-containing protein [Taibaiella soli]|uniref:Uncharacterized protein n=1 Tax=Taibaiella soli TaxID=1649169 RepID=A0A2W2B403_9BACT|nr:NPCBM/NEW2 domain-containing protein [Taibaiella soli]PZF70857.1 hypothetical protein DN068_21315 [Taibaiella soli]
MRNPYRVTNIPGIKVGDNVGYILVSDTQENSWEELTLYSNAGDNGGWPYYEGFTRWVDYNNGTAFYQIPQPPPTFTWPLISWPHNENGQVGKAPGTIAQVLINGVQRNITDLPGVKNFKGNCSTGNTFYAGNAGDPYGGVLNDAMLFAIYTEDSVRVMKFAHSGNGVVDFNNPTGVTAVSQAGVVFLGTNPYNHYVYAVGNYGATDYICRLESVDHISPVAVISTDGNTSSTTNTVTTQFYGSQSYDVDNSKPSLAYSWNFGDGTVVTGMNPKHTFTVTGNAPATQTVVLTVSDPYGDSSIASTTINLNNLPPQINSISVKDPNGNSINNVVLDSLSGSIFPVILTANVSDDHTANSALKYVWEVDRCHNDHVHPGAPTPGAATFNTNLIAEGGCGDGASYWFKITLTVTDESGASTVYQKNVYQRCADLVFQKLTVNPVPTQLLQNGSCQITASSSSGLPVSFEVRSGPVIVDAQTGLVTFSGQPGDATVAVLQSGNSTYGAAYPVEVNFKVVNQYMPAKPVASFIIPALTFDANSSYVNTGQPITFFNTSTGDADNTTYQWTFTSGQPSITSATQASPQVTFSKPNDWMSATLTVTNSLGTSTCSYASNDVWFDRQNGWIATKTPTDQTQPVGPLSLQASKTTSSSTVLSWTAATDNVGISSYLIYQNNTFLATVGATTLSYAVTGLTDGTSYNFEVKAQNAAGNISNGSSVTVVTTSSCATTIFLSDLNWAKEDHSYLGPQMDKSISGNTLNIDGVTYKKGIGTHAINHIYYTTNKKYSRFTSTVGVDDEVSAVGPSSIKFNVYGDGVLISSSPVMRPKQYYNIDVSIIDYSEIELEVTDAGDGINSDHADWGNAMFYLPIPCPAGLVAPTAVSPQTFTGSATIANLVATGTNIKWYDAAAGGNLLSSSTALTSGNVYYASQTIGGIESARTPVTVSITAPPSCPSVYLSDLTPVAASQGYGTLQMNKSVIGNAININGVAYARGLGTHAISHIIYATNKQYSVFQSTVGIDDEAGGTIPSVQFNVYGDGNLISSSPVMRPKESFNINVDISNYSQVALEVTDGGDGINSDHADWGDAKFTLSCSSGAPLAPTAASPQTFTGSVTVANLVATGTSIKWYDAATGGNFLSSSTALTSGDTYYASQAVGGIESARTPVTVSVTAPPSCPSVYLSDLIPVAANQGYGTLQMNKSVIGNAININGVAYVHGLGTHAISHIIYTTNKQYSVFQSIVGIDDEVGGAIPSVQFNVYGDGNLISSSPVMRPKESFNIKTDISSYSQVALEVTDGGDGINSDHADWGDAKFTSSCNGSMSTTARSVLVNDSTALMNGAGTVKVYPVPFTNSLTIESNGWTGMTAIKLIDINGRIVREAAKYITDGNRAEVLSNLSALPGGVYILVLNNDKEVIRISVKKN